MAIRNKDASYIDELLKDAAALKKLTKLLRKDKSNSTEYTKTEILHHKAADRRKKRKRGGHK